MPNPWLTVPLSDYEGHMSSPEVAQLAALSDLFAEALAFIRPKSVAVLGVAGGNGLDRVDSNITTRVVGVDIHSDYLETTRQRYPLLELHRCDLTQETLAIEPVELVHAALVFEHAGTKKCLDNALALTGHALSVVLKLPSATTPGVSATRFPSIQNLAADFALIDPVTLSSAIEARGALRKTRETHRDLPSGKAFWMGIFVCGGATLS
jgi:hypothetical protein